MYSKYVYCDSQLLPYSSPCIYPVHEPFCYFHSSHRDLYQARAGPGQNGCLRQGEQLSFSRAVDPDLHGSVFIFPPGSESRWVKLKRNYRINARKLIINAFFFKLNIWTSSMVFTLSNLFLQLQQTLHKVIIKKNVSWVRIRIENAWSGFVLKKKTQLDPDPQPCIYRTAHFFKTEILLFVAVIRCSARLRCVPSLVGCTRTASGGLRTRPSLFSPGQAGAAAGQTSR